MVRPVCGWCKKVRVKIGEEPTSDVQNNSHGVCPDCFIESMSGIMLEDELMKAKQEHLAELERDSQEWVEDPHKDEVEEV